VLGLTNREVVQQVLEERSYAKGEGALLSAAEQPRALPRLRQRARFLDDALRKAHLVRVVPILGSVGCPYSCDFCSDAEVPYRPLPFDDLADDLRFAAARCPRRMSSASRRPASQHCYRELKLGPRTIRRADFADLRAEKRWPLSARR
jgi:hypothetical protein